MAKFIVVCLVYIVAAALTSCSASRPLVTAAVSSPDLSHSTTRSAPSLVFPTKSNRASTTTESQNVRSAELDGQLTASDAEEFDDDFGPCMEEEHEEFAGGRPCHRMLPDYGPPRSNPDVKH